MPENGKESRRSRGEWPVPDLEEKVRDSGWASPARGFVAKTKGPDLILNVLGTTGRFKRGVLQRNDLIWLWERWFWLLSGEQTRGGGVRSGNRGPGRELLGTQLRGR